MGVRLLLRDEILTARIIGEIDHHTARMVREEIDSAAQKVKPLRLCLDFTEVPFMDSSGVGLILGVSENPNPLYRTAVKKFGMYQYDLGAAVQTLCLAAADLGLGSCIMSTIRNKKQLQDLLGIPQGQEICLVVALGYPDGDPAASRERLSLEEICYFNPGIPAERPDDPSRS